MSAVSRRIVQGLLRQRKFGDPSEEEESRSTGIDEITGRNVKFFNLEERMEFLMNLVK